MKIKVYYWLVTLDGRSHIEFLDETTNQPRTGKVLELDETTPNNPFKVLLDDNKTEVLVDASLAIRDLEGAGYCQRYSGKKCWQHR